MKKRYDQEDSYCTSFITKVIHCEKRKDDYCIILEKTYFYPEGGGQAADQGYIGEVFVYDVHEIGGEIIHYTKEALEVGKQYECKIDWKRRFDHMQNHSGEHIVSGLIHKRYGYNNVGFHMGKVIQIDFDGPLSIEDCRIIEKEANQCIMKNVDIVASFPDITKIDYRSKKEIEGDVRIVTIEGIDACACCGTHVRKTGEIGCIKILSVEKHKQGVRLEMIAGMRAYSYLAKIYEENH